MWREREVLGVIVLPQLCTDLTGIELHLRDAQKAVGLLGNAKGAAKPIPFGEDTCVLLAKEHLVDYIEFRALLDGRGLLRHTFRPRDAGCCMCVRR